MKGRIKNKEVYKGITAEGGGGRKENALWSSRFFSLPLETVSRMLYINDVFFYNATIGFINAYYY